MTASRWGSFVEQGSVLDKIPVADLEFRRLNNGDGRDGGWYDGRWMTYMAAVNFEASRENAASLLKFKSSV